MERVAADEPEDQADRREQAVEHQGEDQLRDRPADREGQRPSSRRRSAAWSRGQTRPSRPMVRARPRGRSPGWRDRGRTTARPPGRRRRRAKGRRTAGASCSAGRNWMSDHCIGPRGSVTQSSWNWARYCSRAASSGLPRGRVLGDDDVFEHQHVHVGGQEAAVGVLRRADDRLAADVEAGVDEHGAAGQALETPRSRRWNRGLRSLVDGLDPGAVVDVRDRRDRPSARR